jgi:hypothetical protein
MTTLVHPASGAAAPDQPPTGGLAEQAPRQEGDGARRLLAELGAGHAGRIAEVRLDPDRLLTGSPVQVGAHVRVIEVGGRGWRHVRIGHREYSVPSRLATQIVVDLSEEPEPAAADPHAGAAACYEVVCSRIARGFWRVMVVRRDNGAVVKGDVFDDADAAKAASAALREDLAAMSPAGFRARHRLP